MSKKTAAINLNSLPFKELKEQAKDLPDTKTLNRFELTQALRTAKGTAALEVENPRTLKIRMKTIRVKKNDDTNVGHKSQLRRHLARLKRVSRWAKK